MLLVQQTNFEYFEWFAEHYAVSFVNSGRFVGSERLLDSAQLGYSYYFEYSINFEQSEHSE